MENLINQSKRILKQQETSAWIALIALSMAIGFTASGIMLIIKLFKC